MKTIFAIYDRMLTGGDPIGLFDSRQAAELFIDYVGKHDALSDTGYFVIIERTLNPDPRDYCDEF